MMVMGSVVFNAPDDQDWALLLLADHSMPPEILSNPVTVTTQDESYQYGVQASGEPLPLFYLLRAPVSMTIDSRTGQIEWLPSTSGEFLVEVQAENKAGSDEQLYTVLVSPIPVHEEYFPLINKWIEQPLYNIFACITLKVRYIGIKGDLQINGIYCISNGNEIDGNSISVVICWEWLDKLDEKLTR